MRHYALLVMFTWLALSAEGLVHKLSASTRAAPKPLVSLRMGATEQLTDGPPTPRRLALAKIAKEEAQQRKKVMKQRGSQFGIGIAVVGLSLACGGPSAALLLRTFLGTLACTLPGLWDGHLAVSYGYGLTMIWQVWCFLPVVSPRSAPASMRLLMLAYALYGLKVCAFQAVRDADPAYVTKALEPMRKQQAKSKRRAGGKPVPPVGFSTARLPLVLGVGTLLSTFAFPLHAAAQASSSGLSTLGGLLGGLLALGGLGLQTVADVQKLAFKRECGADALCRTGLFSLSRHPNYLGELAFQAGVLLAGLASAVASGGAFRAVARAVLSCLAPLAFCGIMIGATRSLEERQLAAYADEINYREWVRTTPRLFIGGSRVRQAAGEWEAAVGAARTSTRRAWRRWRGRGGMSDGGSLDDADDDGELLVLGEQQDVEDYSIYVEAAEPAPDKKEGGAVVGRLAQGVTAATAAASAGLSAITTDPTREVLAAKEEKEQLGEEIWNIVSVTGLAGVAAWVLGAAGNALFF